MISVDFEVMGLPLIPPGPIFFIFLSGVDKFSLLMVVFVAIIPSIAVSKNISITSSRSLVFKSGDIFKRRGFLFDFSFLISSSALIIFLVAFLSCSSFKFLMLGQLRFITR